jgi:hypothetical protein
MSKQDIKDMMVHYKTMLRSPTISTAMAAHVKTKLADLMLESDDADDDDSTALSRSYSVPHAAPPRTSSGINQVAAAKKIAATSSFQPTITVSPLITNNITNHYGDSVG